MATRRPIVARWSKVPSLCSHLFDNVPIHRTKAAVLYSWPFLYVLGGRSGRTACRDFWRFNIENEQWEEIFLEDQPLLENHAACWLNHCLYVFGGQFSHYATMMMWKEGQRRFVPAKPSKDQNGNSSRSPLNVRGHSLVAHEDSVYLFGGWADVTGASDQLWKFNPGSNEWKLLKMVRGPSARHSHSAVVYNQAMWIFGGIRNFSVLGDLWRIEFDNSGALVRCEEIKCRYSPGARYGHSACVVGQKMFAFGGYDADGLATDNFWCFDFIDRYWHNITPDHKTDEPILWPQASAFHRCVAVDPPRHAAPLIDYDDAVTLVTPFQRGGATSSSGDSGYASSHGRNTDSASVSSNGKPSLLNQSHHQVSLAGQTTDPHFLRPAAADNHAYSDEEELDMAQSPKDDDNFALPGSVMGHYNDKPHQKRKTPSAASTSSHIEMKPYPSPNGHSRTVQGHSVLESVQEIQAVDDFQASTSFAVEAPKKDIVNSVLTPFGTGSRATSIYLVGTSCADANSPQKMSKCLKLWSCKLGDNSEETVHTV